MTTTTSDRLLSELDRQRKYLDELPEDFQYPLFNVRHAVESQRASGYRSTAAAAREIIDNSIEAGASAIDVVFDTDLETGRRSVSAIAFIDDGAGMLPDMLRYALTWGGGTHFNDHDFIGKFGFGLPNSSINQTRRVEVYSRVEPEAPIMCAILDITHVSAFGLQTIEPPEEAPLPDFVSRYLTKNGISFDHGTVVVWRKPDRLSYKRAANLKEQLVDDFGVVYRYLLANNEAKPDGLRLRVGEVTVAPVDPLFLTPGARYYVAEGGATATERRSIPVRYFRDEQTGEFHLERIEDPVEVDDAVREGAVIGTMHVTVARFPVGFAAEGKLDSEDAKRRMQIRKTRRGMSFVRAGREIQTVDLFPTSSKDESKGLGSWPVLQGYALHWGIEVRFDPELDDVFGITNDKQTVRPIEDFWRVLSDAGIDDAAKRENRWQEEQRRKTAKATTPEIPTSAELAARTAGVATNQRSEVPPKDRESATRKIEDELRKSNPAPTPEQIEAARRAARAEAKRRPYKIEYVELPNGPWFEPEWHGEQLVVQVNTSHRFYQVLYGDLLRGSGTGRAKDGLDFVLITLAKSELTIDDESFAQFVATRRRTVDSPFLEAGLAQLAAASPLPEDTTSDVGSSPGDADTEA